MQAFLQTSHYLDFDHPLVAATAARLAVRQESEEAVVRRCFEFVRDGIAHSWDFKRNPVTVKASEALEQGTGYCYAKSHLLAALLRANNIPAGLCYQRLSVGEAGAPYCLHGLNAVYLRQYGWYRLDARGNKPGVAAEFCPPHEALAFPVRGPEEYDLPEIWAEPLPVVLAVLERYDDIFQVAENLPDIGVVG